MILWLLLFGLVLAISFVLAAKSMRDFQEISPADNGLYLIRSPGGLSYEVLNALQQSLKPGQLLSLERLFKGDKSALVIFGPKDLLKVSVLDLLELEDYTFVTEQVSAWEIRGGTGNWRGIFTNLKLLESEHFWWQVIFSKGFKVQIRAVLVSANPVKIEKLAQSLGGDGFSSQHVLDFYQKRSYNFNNKNPNLSANEVLDLIKI